jgi:hypothetical protein
MHLRTRSLLLCLAVLGCDGPPTGTPTPPRQPLLASASALSPGSTATVRGRGLTGESTILVDGSPVPLAASSDSTASFTMPELRPCDTDGRLIALALPSAPTAPIHSGLRLTTTLGLAVGESRLLTIADLDGCIQLAAADADFVLSALNTDRAATEQMATLATLTAWTSTDPAPPEVRRTRTVGRRSAAPTIRAAGAAPGGLLPWPAPYASAPRLFDPAYATAQPGDTVRFVDWTRAASCDGAPENAPAYRAVVVAAAGLTVVAADLRLANAADYLSPAGRAYFQRAAEIADPLVVTTTRRVFDADYRPLPAAGGRHFHVISSISGVARSTDGNTSKPQAHCSLASEMVTTLHAPPTGQNDDGPRVLATGIVHEYAHNADEITARRYGRPGGSIGWMQEAWAVNAEETAARVALRAPTRARLSGLGAGTPFRAGTTNSDWGLYPQRSPWTGTGAYKQGAALISYAREVAGEAGLDAPGPNVFLQLVAGDAWTLDALATALGSTPAALLDSWALADATDDLAAEATPLPRLASWDDAERVAGNEGPRGGTPAEARPSRTIRRSGSRSTVALAAAPGSYAAAYVFAEGGLGITLRITRSDPPAVIRITRTR